MRGRLFGQKLPYLLLKLLFFKLMLLLLGSYLMLKLLNCQLTLSREHRSNNRLNLSHVLILQLIRVQLRLINCKPLELRIDQLAQILKPCSRKFLKFGQLTFIHPFQLLRKFFFLKRQVEHRVSLDVDGSPILVVLGQLELLFGEGVGGGRPHDSGAKGD